MPKVQPIQTSFSSGEISPLLLAQTTSERYATGLSICENFIPRAQGPLDFRPGFQHISSFEGEDTLEDGRLFGFNLNPETNFVVAVGASWVQVFDENGPVLGGIAGINLITNSEFNSALLGWTTDTSGPQDPDVSWDPEEVAATLYTSHHNAFASLGQQFQPAAAADHALYFSAYPEVDATNDVTVMIGTSFGDGSVLSQPVSPGIGQLLSFTTTDTSPLWVTFEANGDGGTWFIDSVRIRQVDLSAQPVRFPSPWSGFARWPIKFEPHPTAAQLLFAHPNVPQQRLTVTAGNVWVLEPIPFTAPPAVWTGTNYPGALTFADGRLWFGGAPNEPTRFWGSQSDDYFNFTGGTLPADAVEFTIAKKGKITWMTGARKLVIGTETREFIATAQDGVLQPDDINADPQSAYGSFAGQHVDVGEKAVYVSAGERKLRAVGYRWQEDAWISVDLAWPSEHITEGRVRDIVFQKDPLQLLWMAERTKNQLLLCAYDREQNQVGWARCPVDGRILGVASTEFAGITDMWALIRYDDVGKTYIERFDIQHPHFLDSHITIALPTPGTTITGLGHLEGVSCGVVADYALHPDRTVSGGQIELQRPATVVTVGRKYQGKVLTLPLEGGNQTGTSQGVKKRYNRVFVRVESSYPPLVNGERPPDRTPSTPMGVIEPPTTGDIDVRTLGWGRTAQLEIVQELPLPTRVLGIFGETALEPVDDR